MRKKIISILLIMMILIATICQVVNALSFTVTMEHKENAVPESTEFAVTIKVSNLDVGDNGINTLSGVLKYDTDIFETINDSNIEGLNRWVPTYDFSTGEIKLTKNTYVSSSQEVLKISFKTKSGVTGKTGTISLSNIVGSDTENDIVASDISTTITVGENADNNINVVDNNKGEISTVTGNSINNNEVSNNASNNTANNTVNNAANNTTNKVTNNSVSEVPYTGVDDTIVPVIIAIIAVALVFYIKIEKINNDLK